MQFTPFTLNCNGRLLVAEKPLIMGILNATPDSFHAASRIASVQQAVDQAGAMLESGATLLDVGGMSSRPGAELISSAEEIDRVLPVIEAIVAAYPDSYVSVDTIYAATAISSVKAGAAMINDISAGKFDPQLFEVLPQLKVPYVLMHMPGKPSDMQAFTESYGDDVIVAVFDFLAERLIALRESGVKDILVDPGWGFGKSVAQNYEILRNLKAFKQLGVPVFVGISRKSSIWRPLKITAAESLSATSALHLFALQQGASVLRVHDVAEAVQVLKLHELLLAADREKAHTH
ncbi:dihydropteroate synthase [Neolewinella aurantiaca]|uniref:dihydropteroate synthase n=1 Tax=Neolewinella aurantiaca TaxID=2602767 RepID=A0A5C7FAB1_9BACT|nr:dihydropteroate synthase [Neolewinella aurantiaca]TXF87572.1 dihydropteroate synthase [Neolewinella aurantiaca]